jgi:cobalt-zinc-cadmium efflux system outer membrane protein
VALAGEDLMRAFVVPFVTVVVGLVSGPAWAEGEPEDAPFPSLAVVVARAREQAPEVQAARAGVGVAHAGRAGAQLSVLGNPYLEVVGDRGGQGREVTVGATLWLPFEVWGQRRARVGEVDARVRWQTANLAAVRALVAGEAVRAYGAAVVEQQVVQTFEAIVATVRAEAELYRQRLAAGDATEQDAAAMDLELARHTLSLAESRADLQRALTELAQLTGTDGYGPPDQVPAEPPAPVDLAPAAAVAAQSPAVGRLRAEVSVHERTWERLGAEARLPFSLMLQGGRGEVGELRLGLGLAITLPLTRYNQGERAVAAAERSRAEVEAGARQSATASTLRGLRREREQIRAARREVAAALEPAGQRAVAAADAVYRAGKGELLRVLTARRDLVQLRTRRLDLVRREWGVVGQMVSLTGELP